MLLSSKFRIIDNFIYPNGRKLNITLALLFAVFFVVYINIVIFNLI